MKHVNEKWLDIAALEDIPRRGGRVLKAPDGCIAVFRTVDDQVFALEDRCPHKQGPLSQGIVHGASVTCPLHNWVISLKTGEAQGADEGAVRTFPVQVRDGRVLISESCLRIERTEDA
ncbi:MAG: nitrite reductase small subunit NirD [Minwuia sp.]|uniref:nitrite reductase small subunit NirD n=1 Tax=Minwuia sp. TaxID=2493630 RepID=UPI003A880765